MLRWCVHLHSTSLGYNHSLTVTVIQDQAIQASHASQLEAEVSRLREDNASLSRKLSDMSGLEAAKKKVESKMAQLEERMDELVTDRVSQRENELNATYDEKLRNYEDR